MIILLNTSTATAELTIIEDTKQQRYEWLADRELAKGLLQWMNEKLQENNKQLSDIRGIGVYIGPGSFTGLRIGLTVLNTLADGLSVPIVGVKGDDWKNIAIQRLTGGDNDRIVLPEYGSAVNITQPRK